MAGISPSGVAAAFDHCSVHVTGAREWVRRWKRAKLHGADTEAVWACLNLRQYRQSGIGICTLMGTRTLRRVAVDVLMSLRRGTVVRRRNRLLLTATFVEWPGERDLLLPSARKTALSWLITLRHNRWIADHVEPSVFGSGPKRDSMVCPYQKILPFAQSRRRLSGYAGDSTRWMGA